MTQWQDFLKGHNAQQDETGVSFFTDTQTIEIRPDKNYIVDLSHFATLTIEGPDATKFLQGQVTCDIRSLSSLSLLGAHCTHKGKILFNFRALQTTPETIVLTLPRSLVTQAHAHLSKYIVFSKAKLAVDSLPLERIQISGPQACNHLQEQGFTLPEDTNQFTHTKDNESWVIKIDHSTYEVWTTHQHAENLWLSASANFAAIGYQQATGLDNYRGICWVNTETTDEYFPHSLNMQCIDAISFKKGCYTGQEIVARMEYKGRPKKRLYLIEFTHSQTPEASAALFSTSHKNSVGEILQLAAISPGNYSALAVISNQHTSDNALFIGDSLTEKVEIKALPYAINTTEAV